MSKGFATSLLLAGTFVAAILVGGCGGNAPNAVVPAEGAYRGSEPPEGISMPAFSLRDVLTGAPVESADLRGRVVLVTFVDTDCHDKCPLLASAIGEALRLLPGSVRQQTSALAISVNPLIDKRPSVRRFLRERHAEAITYLSGSVAELVPIWKRFGVVSAYETGDADTHSADVRVFNPDGIWVSTQHSGVDLTPANLVHDITRALED
jgi:cytochrome oxidase Cu insertion factor (SCO1/SenC/PrrC family)